MTSKLIVALDQPTKKEALDLCDRLGVTVDFYKIGLELFIQEGPKMILELKSRGKGVFLDLKLHDIPNQVARSCRRIAGLGVDMFTIHTQGGKEMIASAVEATLDESNKLGIDSPKILGVTVLTSFSQDDLTEIGVGRRLKEQVKSLSELAVGQGISGLVASPFEIEEIRALGGDGLLIVTPGIRLEGEERGDQKRVMGPKEAVEKGATHLVIGRPISQALDPQKKAYEIIKMMEEAKI